MPDLPLFHIVEVKAGALVVRWIEPEHASKYFFCIPHPTEAPQAEAVAVQAGGIKGTSYSPPVKQKSPS